MPAYEYVCESCRNRFETWQKITEDPIQICPTCGGHVRRVLYPVGLVFKGSGFYKTDHRDASSASSAKAESDAAKVGTPAASETKTGTFDAPAAPSATPAASSAGSDAKSETKPATPAKTPAPASD